MREYTGSNKYPPTIREISRSTGLNTVMVYDALDSLVERGLVRVLTSNYIRRYTIPGMEDKRFS